MENPQGAAAAAATDGSSSTPPLVITVSDPIKNSEGSLGGAYITYKVNTETTLAEFEFKQFSVIRRFSDFVWLRQLLLSILPGAVIPPLPEKGLMKSFSPEFVEGRRRALERFLNRCATHPLVGVHERFRMFLQADDEALAKAKQDANTKQGGGFFSGLASMTMSSKAEQVKSEQDLQFEEISVYVSNLESQMQNVAKHTASLVRRGRELAQGLCDFSLAFDLLSQHETQALISALKQVSDTADQLSLIAAEQVEKEQMWFEEPIVDYIQMLGAVKDALDKRAQARKTYFVAVSDKELKASALEKLQATATPKADKIAAAEESLQAAQTAEEAAQTHFETVSQRALDEVDRFKHTKADDMRKVVLDYVQLQIEYNKRMEQQWAALVPEIEKIEVEPRPEAMPTVMDAALPDEPPAAPEAAAAAAEPAPTPPPADVPPPADDAAAV